jgi:hypothetical protein
MKSGMHFRQRPTRYRRSLAPARTSQSDKSGHPWLVKLAVGKRPNVSRPADRDNF